MTMRFRVFLLACAATAAAIACSSSGRAPAPPGPSRPGTGVSEPNPNVLPPRTPPTAAPTAPPTPPPPAPTPGAAVPVESPAPAPVPLAAAVPPQPPGSSSPRPYEDVLKLKKAGLSDEFILNKIRAENVHYQLTTAEILDLKAAGVSESVLEVMLRSGQPQPQAGLGATVARRAEFPGLSLVGRGFLGLGTKTKNVGRLVVDGDTIAWAGSEDPEKNFSIYAKNVKEIFNTCILRPNQNLCLEVGFVTYTGDEHKFRDPGWRNGDNRLVTEVTNYFKQAFPNLFFSARAVNEL